MLKAKTLSNPGNLVYFSTALLIVTSVVVPLIYKEQIIGVGTFLIDRYGQDNLDITIFLLTAISGSPVALPVWIYAIYGTMLGYDPFRLILVVSLGASFGSQITYCLGRYFGTCSFVKRKFPKLENHPWTDGRSFWITTGIVFGGTAAPLPLDLIYAACGFKRYPAFIFWINIFFARILRYSLLVYGWKLVSDMSIFNFI